MNIHQKVDAYFRATADEHHRYRSWEHCYTYFRSVGQDGLAANRDHAALQLAFYLASWGMYRGSTFLLRYAYTVHRGVIDVLAQPRFATIWTAEFGASDADDGLVPVMRQLIDDLRLAYRPYMAIDESQKPTDTLITKILLGTFGCLPACDEYFVAGFKAEGRRFSRLNEAFIGSVHGYCREHLTEFMSEQAAIKATRGIHYPLMKLVDMYFWQVGFDKAADKQRG